MWCMGDLRKVGLCGVWVTYVRLVCVVAAASMPAAASAVGVVAVGGARFVVGVVTADGNWWWR